jgi:hypothetical protein
MAWNKGTLQLLSDPRKEFADVTGHILTGINLRPTVTGWQMIVKRVRTDTREKEVCFVDGWSIEDLFEAFYSGMTVAPDTLVWKPDKF